MLRREGRTWTVIQPRGIGELPMEYDGFTTLRDAIRCTAQLEAKR